MFDFPMTDATISTSLYCIIFYLFLVVLTYGHGITSLNTSSSFITRKEKISIFLIGFLIVTHCLKGDFFHMMWAVKDYIFRPGYYNYGEDVYIWIGQIVEKNYFLFRVIVWGGAFITYCITARRMGVPVYFSAVLILLTHIVTFSYARATAAMAIYYLGLSYLCHPIQNKTSLSIIIGILLIYASTFFHNSAIMMVASTLMFVLPVKKWSIVLALVLIPLFANTIKDYFHQIILLGNEEDILIAKMQNYSERELERGVAALLITTFEYASFYLPFIISTIVLFRNRLYSQISNGIFSMYKVALGLLLGSFVFLFFGPSFITFFYRIMFMTMIPITLIIAKLHCDGYLSRRHLYWCIFPGLGFNIIRHLYDVYLQII